ncbi:unnamed protein product [Dicrocoelium dendriticum]|nr:unnamed protein product [Dicrocoelium dendriticum]
MLSNSPLGGSSDSSLEYCFTNIFALTDFNGIQYRKYVLKTQREYKNLLEDPIIKSFSLCQQNSILSAWVRSKRNAEKCDPCSFSKFSKDLWVFWYGNGDLPNAGSCILPDLYEEEKGNWRQGLSYEIRTVLFRALHNVVEKCLLNKGFVRLGRWFVQPYKHNCSEDYTQYSISFSFFLHGESTVCASLDLRQHSLVRRVSLKHIQHCSSNQKPIPVILAPYGIAAELSGFESIHKSEDDFSKELEAWSSFYPLRCASDHDISDSPTGGLPSFITTSPTQGSRSQVHSRCKSPPDKRPHLNKSVPKDLDFIPPFVEVIVGGFRMRYPTCFVLLVDSDDDAASTGACPKSEYPPHAHVHSSSKQIPQPSCDIKQGINAELKCPHSWRIPKRKVLHLTRTRSIPGRYSTRSFECSLQSDLGFDVRRMHLGEVALSRSRRDRLIPSSFKLPTPCSDLAALSESNDSADAFCKGISVTCSAYSLSSRNSDPISCRCQRPCLPRQLLSYGPFHHIDADTRCALRGLISELNTVGDSSHNFSQHQAIGTVSHDPSMPTLSPQQPTSLSGPSTTSGPHWSCVSKSSTELLRGVANKGDLTVTVSTSLVPTAPPSLSFSNPARISTIPHISNLASPTVGLPNGLVSVERPASPVSETSTSSSRPPTALLSITKPSLKSVWLTEQISMEAPKRPVLKLNLADECEEDQPCTTDLCPSTNAIKAQSAVFFASSDEYHSSDGCSRPKRPRISCISNPNDQYDAEDTSERAKFCGMERGSFSSDTPPDSVGFDSCEDECTVPNDLLGCPLSSSGCNTNSLLNRTLGLMVHKGVSLASSTGSGHLGPAELALMLPTPPSHDAPQPSPGDVIAVGASTTGNTRTNLPGFATDVADSPTPPGIFLTHNLLDSCNTFDQSVAMTLQQPLSPPQTQLLNLAKQSCVQNYNFTTLDPIKDWSFVRPCAAYFGITGSYQFCRNDSSLFPKSIPHVQLAYDHRALRNYRSSICDPSLCADHMGSPSVGLVRSTSSPPRQIKCALTSPNGLSVHQFETSSVELKPSTLDSVVSTSSTGLLIPSAFDTEPATATSTTYFNHEGSQSHLPESDAILVNIMLSDSMLNLFRDHNFDSCNICECSSSVMGSEIDLYLVNCAPAAGSGKTQRPSLGSVGSGSAGGFGPHDLVNGSAFGCANECKCGFSAVMNQKYVVNGNLFYEDEVEVTSLFLPSEHMPDRPRVYSSPPVYNQKLGWWAGPCSPSHEHLMLLLRMMQTVYDELCVRQLMDTLRRLRSPSLLDSIKEDMIEYDDACTLVAAALSESCISHDSKSRDAGNVSNSRVAVNPSFLFKARSKIPENHNDQIRLLATMRPWLQEAISSTRLLESNYTVDGPLTWKAFHQLAGRGSEETCKPQPVPQLRVGSSDNEHLLISPFALRDWDRLALSPLSLAKHLAYAVVIPGDPHELACTINPASNASTVKQEQNESKHYLLSRHNQEATSCRSFVPGDKHTIPSALVGFLKELSLTYENFRLGRHLPYYLPELNRPETAFITVHPLEDKLATPEEDNFGCFSPDSYRALVHMLEGHCTSPAAFLNCLQSYVSSACRQTISLFIERGVSIPVPITRGGKCTTSNDVGTKLFPKFGFQRLANSFKRDHDKENDPKIQARQTQGRDGKILGHSSTDPHNGQGPLTSSMDTSHWGTAEDAYLVVYLLNPFFQVRGVHCALHRWIVFYLSDCIFNMPSGDSLSFCFVSFSFGAVLSHHYSPMHFGYALPCTP